MEEVKSNYRSQYRVESTEEHAPANMGGAGHITS